VHPFIAAYLEKGFWSMRRQWEFKYFVLIKIIPIPSFYIYEYHFYSRFNREIEEEIEENNDSNIK